MSALVPLMTSTGPLLDRASAGVRALMNAVSRREGEFFEEGHYSAAQVKRELQEANVEAKVRALKRLLAAHASGVDVSGLLPEVVKAIAVPSLELKRLVYLFLILHSETSRDVTLLSINSFQKDLADRNQIIRATALKALASIRLLEVVQLLMAAMRRAAADSSPFVRRTAAQCVIKVFSLDPDQFQELQKIVLTLLKDVEISVVGAALIAFRELCIRHGSADCLRYYEAQVRHPQQQQQQQQYHHQQQQENGYLPLPVEEEQQQQQQNSPRGYSEGRRRWLQQPDSDPSSSGGRDASGDATARQRQETGAGRGEEGDKQQQQHVGMHWRTEAQLQGRWNSQDEGRHDGSHGGGGGGAMHAAAAIDPAAATQQSAASSKMLRPHRDAAHLNMSAAAAAKLKSFKAQEYALALLHQHYRRLQESMLQLEPFAQVVAVDLFLRYARLFFTEPAAAFKRRRQQQQKTQEAQQHEPPREKQYGEDRKGRARDISLYGNSSSSSTGSARSGSGFAADGMPTYEKIVEESTTNPLPADLRVFLWNLGQLLYSESVAVVAAVAAAFYHLLPAAAWKPLVHPLLRCMYTSSVEFQEPLLHITAALAAAAPSLFLPHFRSFFLAFNDPPCVRQGKLLVLRRLLFSPRFASAAAAAEEGRTLPPLLLQELCTYIRWPGDPLLLSTCFNFLVNIALRFPSGQSACMQIFVQLLDTPASCALASEAILGLQVLLQQQQQEQQQQSQQQQQRLQQVGGRAAGAAAAAVAESGIAEWREKKPSFRGADTKKQPRGRQQLGWLVLQLAMHLSRVTQGAAARASIVWIVGEYQREVGWVAADVFRQLASSFKAEAGEVKLQILLLGLKVWALHWVNKQQLKEQEQEQQQQEGQFSALHADSESNGTAAARTAAGRGSERQIILEEGHSNGIFSAAAAASPVAASAAAAASPASAASAAAAASPAAASAAAAASPASAASAAAAASAASAAAAEGRKQVGNEQQQQHQQRTYPQGWAEEAPQKGGSSAYEVRQQEKHPHEDGEQFYLLPPPTPEESAAAFPRIDKMLKYVCETASFDICYDVRDVARLYFAVSRLALASERKTSCKSLLSSSNRENSFTSIDNTGDTIDRGSCMPCNTASTNTGNTDKSSSTSNITDSRSDKEGSNAATAVAENDSDLSHVLEGLAGCGGQMFKNACAKKALADMSQFAQKYMRTLAKGSARGPRSKTRLQHSMKKIHHPVGAVASTAAAAATSSLESDRKCESTCSTEGANSGDSNSSRLMRSTSSTSSSGSCSEQRNSSSGAAAAEESPSSCLWEQQEAGEGSAGQMILGSLSDLLGERMSGYVDLPPFSAADSSDNLRNVEPTAAPSELAKCLMRGSAAAAAKSGERSSMLSSSYYMDLQEVKAISSDDIVVKRSAAALMGRDADVKADFTPLDLDSFYADDMQSNGVAAAVPQALQQVHDCPAAASFSTDRAPKAAVPVSGNVNAFLPALGTDTFLASSDSVMGSETFPGKQKENVQQQQRSLWDMFGEAHVPPLHSGEPMVQQVQSEGQSIAQYDGKESTTFLSVDQVLGSGNLMANQVRGRGGGVAVAGEDEESDEEKGFAEANA